MSAVPVGLPGLAAVIATRVPGSPGGVRSLAASWRRSGDRIGEGASLMSSAASSAPSWQGVSAQAFSAAASSLSGELSGRAGDLGRGAGVMDAYAGVLERAHGMAAELQAQAARLLVTSIASPATVPACQVAATVITTTFNTLLSTIDLAAVEIELVSKVRREYRLRDALSPEFIKEAGFDYVFVDCPPSLGLLTTNALNAVEEVLIPIQCEYYALEGVNQLLKYITMVQHQLNPQLHISAILLTMFDGRTKLAEEVSADVRNTFGALVLRNRIPRSVKVSEAPGFGQTVLDYDPGSRGSMAYMDAAKELANRGDVRFVK